MKNPQEDYKILNHNGYKIYFSKNDFSETTIKHAKEICKLHAFSSNAGNKVSQVYYLRGHRKFAEYGKVLIGALEELQTLPNDLYKMLENMEFWNFDGKYCHEINGKSGETYNSFILRCIAADARAFVEAHPHYLTGKEGNHVWLADAETKKRLMIIHF